MVLLLRCTLTFLSLAAAVDAFRQHSCGFHRPLVSSTTGKNEFCGFSTKRRQCYTRRRRNSLRSVAMVQENGVAGAAVGEIGGLLPTTTDALNFEIKRLCSSGKVQEAQSLLSAVESQLDTSINKEGEGFPVVKPDQSTYVLVIHGLSNSPGGALKAEQLLRHMSDLSKEHACCTPKGQTYSAVIQAWSKTTKKRNIAAQHADDLLEELWSLYNNTQSKDRSAYIPTRATYTSTISAWARSGLKRRAAERAEELLEEMESFSRENSVIMLGVTTACVNAVLNAWAKSTDPSAAERCEVILKRMESLALSEGRVELQPDTVSFNTVINAFAQSGKRSAPRRAELLLQQMDKLSQEHHFPCQPDTLSFNVVINGWAKSREAAAARRADAILRHMERQNEAQYTIVKPDATTYNNVIHAWSRSKEPDAPQRADEVLKRMENAYSNGNRRARPDANTYNSIINVWAKSKHARAGERALEILNLMKHSEDDSCRPDAVTYTSVIDTLAKCESPDSVENAVALLTEMEESRDVHLKPNVRTYTSAINAIARSRENPQRAEAILERMEALEDASVEPDVVCFNAVINAWGWSQEKGKASQAHQLYQRMMDHFNSGNVNAKPDIVTCNSILNACAFDNGVEESERAATMTIAIQTLEAFQSTAPSFGWPNHVTYGNMLLCISRQMPMSDARLDLAEATFWQCARAGHVSALVISQLRNALDGERLKSLLGSALFVNTPEKFSYDMKSLPRDWRRFAPQSKHRRPNASRKTL